MPDIWVTSDTHFNHVNILRFTDDDGNFTRKFSSVDEMNEIMIDRWNSRVKPGDKVYHLGDVLFGDRQKDGPAILSRLNGKKRLVVGNHDVIYGNQGQNVLHRYFQRIYMWRMMPEKNILMTHVPVHPSVLRESRFEGDSNMINVHGHIHQNKSPDGPYKCVCVDQPGVDYYPIHIEELRF